MGYLCERCKEREGSPTRIVANKDRYLCEICARASGIFRSLTLRLPHQAEIASWSLTKEEIVDEKCPQCGQTWFKIDMTGHCDCPECFKSFASGIKKVRNLSNHRMSLKKQILGGILHKKMQASIEQEQFEKAAVLRDLVALWKR